MSSTNLAGTSPLPFLAGAAVLQHRLVMLDTTAGRVVATSAITDLAIGGSTQAAAAANDPCPVQSLGVARLTASAAIALNAQVMPTAAGAGKISTAAGATAKSCGVALEAALADGDVIAVLLSTPNVNGVVNT